MTTYDAWLLQGSGIDDPDACGCDSPTCGRCHHEGVRLCPCGEKVWPTYTHWRTGPEFAYVGEDGKPRCSTCTALEQAMTDAFCCDE